VHDVDPDQTAHGFTTLEQWVARSPSVSNSRFFATLFTTFGVLAILLAMVGVYGVMSWVVSQRTSEFGIRMALGARAGDVVRMLLGQSLRPILIGLTLGALGGFNLSRALNAMFWRMTSADPLLFTAIAGLMLTAARSQPGCRFTASLASTRRRHSAAIEGATTSELKRQLDVGRGAENPRYLLAGDLTGQ
jgi:ABC-type lipoprotein release transport system permease subunit